MRHDSGLAAQDRDAVKAFLADNGGMVARRLDAGRKCLLLALDFLQQRANRVFSRFKPGQQVFFRGRGLPLTFQVAMRTDGLLRGRKQFFFEKKERQKTFARLSPGRPRQPEKSFYFFFQKEALTLP